MVRGKFRETLNRAPLKWPLGCFNWVPHDAERRPMCFPRLRLVLSYAKLNFLEIKKLIMRIFNFQPFHTKRREILFWILINQTENRLYLPSFPDWIFWNQTHFCLGSNIVKSNWNQVVFTFFSPVNFWNQTEFYLRKFVEQNMLVYMIHFHRWINSMNFNG